MIGRLANPTANSTSIFLSRSKIAHRINQTIKMAIKKFRKEFDWRSFEVCQMPSYRDVSAPIPSIWRLAVSGTQPIIVLNEGPIENSIYCIHSVTGDVSGLDAFARNFGPLRLHGMQVPKHEMNRYFSTTIEAMAERHVSAIEAFQPVGAIHLVGWSAGAIIALEMAQLLRARGREVPLLVALDGAPCNTGAGLSWRNPSYAFRLIANVPRWIRDDRSSSDWSMSGIATRISEKLAARRGAKIELFKNVDTLDAGAVERVITRKGWSPTQKEFVHAMYKAMAQYVARPYTGSVLVFETLTQPLFHLRQVGAAWRAICPASEIVQIQGNHSSLIFEKTATTLAELVIRRLKKL